MAKSKPKAAGKNAKSSQPSTPVAASRSASNTKLSPHLVMKRPAGQAKFQDALLKLEERLKMPVWCFVSGATLDDQIRDMFFSARAANNPWALTRGQEIAVVIDSYGGYASSAYHISRFLQNHCGGFTAVVPRRAKSAATLLAIGAKEIILGEYGELGPLDVQISDGDREETISGLDETQQLERLHNFAVTAFDQTMQLMLFRSGMKSAKVFPHAIKFVTDIVQPMFAHIDVVRYTQMSRLLRVAEEYAKRLLRANYPTELANEIARHLVVAYPEHGFIIDFDEAEQLRLKVRKPDVELRDLLNNLTMSMSSVDEAIGKLVPLEG